MLSCNKNTPRQIITKTLFSLNVAPPFFTTPHLPFIAKLLENAVHIVKLFTFHLGSSHTNVQMFEVKPTHIRMQMYWLWGNKIVVFISQKVIL